MKTACTFRAVNARGDDLVVTLVAHSINKQINFGNFWTAGSQEVTSSG